MFIVYVVILLAWEKISAHIVAGDHICILVGIYSANNGMHCKRRQYMHSQEYLSPITIMRLSPFDYKIAKKQPIIIKKENNKQFIAI